MFIKINNLIQPNGNADYKGLSIDLFIEPPVYDFTNNVSYVSYSGSIVDHSDLLEINESEYNSSKNNKPVDLESQIAYLKEQNAQMLFALVQGGLM